MNRTFKSDEGLPKLAICHRCPLDQDLWLLLYDFVLINICKPACHIMLHSYLTMPAQKKTGILVGKLLVLLVGQATLLHRPCAIAVDSPEGIWFFNVFCCAPK